MRAGGSRWLLAAGAVAAAQMIVVVLVDGAARAGYQSHRNWVSQLSLGPNGWLASANMALSGAWLIAYAAGLSRLDRTRTTVWAARLVLLCGIGFIVVAAVPIDPGLDYPPGVPAVHTPIGFVHQAVAVTVFAAGTAASVLLGRCVARVVPGGTWAVPVGVAVAAVMTLSFAAAGVLVTLDVLGVARGTPSGLLERVALFAGLLWLGGAGLCLLRPGTDRLSAGG